MSKEVAKRIRNFLEENGFEPGVYGWKNPSHWINMENRVVAKVKPNSLSSKGGARTLGVTPTHVIDYFIEEPFVNRFWEEEKIYPYNSKEGLLEILNSIIKNDLGCWG